MCILLNRILKRAQTKGEIIQAQYKGPSSQDRRALQGFIVSESWPTASTQLSFKGLTGSFASRADV